MPKRDQQQNIQAWFDFVSGADNPDYPIVDYYNRLRLLGWSPKKIIGTAILALQEAAGDQIEQPRVSSVDQKFEQIMTAINAISDTLQTAGLRLDAATQATVDDIRSENFGAVERSMASRYQPITYQDDEEDDE
jgi:hypothetical protein